MEEAFFEDETQERMESIKQNNSSMLVVVRLRPLTLKEMAVNPVQCIRSIDSKLLTLIDADQNEKKRIKETQFAFDFVFDKDASTKKIYDESLTSFLGGVLEGFNSTILAYGATGCGKTYTMIGEGNNQGLCALFLIDLLGRAQQLKITHNVALRLSYIQIYNEVIKDLLTSQDRILDIREDPKEGVYAQGATQIQVSSLVELATLLKVGAANRSKETTGSNQASSRSHALILVKAETREKARGIQEEVSIGKLSLVDLAGSERAGGAKGSRQIEGAKINKSLLTLGNCIQSLAEGGKGHVPYRQSKLTRMLKQALGGNCRTAMVACISPFSGSRQDSYNTLLYASRAKNIGNNITRNVLNSQAHLSNYVALIGNLKRQNEQLKKQLRSNKNYSLPQLKTNLSTAQIEADKLSEQIDTHFSKQITLIRAIHEISLKLDRVAFKLLRLQLEQKKGKEKRSIKSPKMQKQSQSAHSLIEQLGSQKQTLESRLEDLTLKRGNLVQQIKDGEWGVNEANSLFTHYRQKKIETELEEIKLRQVRIRSEKAQQDEVLQFIGEEIKVREQIIEEQRLIIQKNNILNRITYSRLNQSQLLPELTERFQIAMKPSLPRNLSSDNQSNEFLQKTAKDTREVKSPRKIINKKINQLQSISSQFSLQKKHLKNRNYSPGSMTKKKMKNGSSKAGKNKPSQFDHIYLQR